MKILRISLVLASVLIISCSEENNQNQSEELQFEFLMMETLENLSVEYPPEDIVMNISSDSNDYEVALFSLTGETKKAVDLGYFVSSKLGDEGTTCSNKFACGIAIKKCLDDGQDARISNGECATYCVTCESPQ